MSAQPIARRGPSGRGSSIATLAAAVHEITVFLDIDACVQGPIEFMEKFGFMHSSQTSCIRISLSARTIPSRPISPFLSPFASQVSQVVHPRLRNIAALHHAVRAIASSSSGTATSLWVSVFSGAPSFS